MVATIHLPTAPLSISYVSPIAILDFSVPSGVHFHISKAPNDLFNTTYSMNALPTLNGSIGYVFTTSDLKMRASRDVRLKDVMERFKIYDLPRRPEGKQEEWLDGERVDTRGQSDSPNLMNQTTSVSSRLSTLWTLLYPFRATRCFIHDQIITHSPGTRLCHV